VTWRIGDTRLFRRASALARSPGWLVLLALGWTIEAVDERYWSVLLCREEHASHSGARRHNRRIEVLEGDHA
jgi:hypothetical protein